MLRRIGLGFLTLALIGAGAFYAFVLWPMRDPQPVALPTTGAFAIEHARIYVSPESAPIDDGAVLVRDGRIDAVGTGVTVPADVPRIACKRCVVTAGFWNVHVHFTEAKWNNAAYADAGRLSQQLGDMLTSRGFTTVVDLGSDLRVTLSLRRRIAHGEVTGPAILTAGSAIYPPDGIPYYLADLPAAIRARMPQPSTSGEARDIVRTNIDRGADVLKLFTGSLITRNTVLPMPESVARAAVEEAHARHQLAFAHPSNLAGTRVAIASGVDVLAHAPSEPTGVDAALLQQAVDHGMAMVPTLKMFATTVNTAPAFMDPIVSVVRRFSALGGTLLFGSDVGYMKDYTTADEFRLLQQAGLDAMGMLRMLTTAPAARFGVLADCGTVSVGKRADLVVLEGDPANDVQQFARVQAVIRDGAAIWTRPLK